MKFTLRHSPFFLIPTLQFSAGAEADSCTVNACTARVIRKDAEYMCREMGVFRASIV